MTRFIDMMRALTLAALLASLHAATAAAQDFPNRPIRVVVPFAAGGGSDTSARLAAEPLGKQLGVSLYVENRDGSGGLVGTETFLRGEADGYSILAAGIAPTVIIPAMRPTSYSAERNLLPLGQISASAQALAVRKDLPVRNLAEFVALAKATPGKLTIGSAGAGTLTQVAAALMAKEWGITLTTVPFRGGGALLPALVGGHIDVAIADTTTFASLHSSGDLRVLATLSTKRSPALPDVPTMLEGGFSGVEAESWTILMANARTPKPIVERLQAAVSAMQGDSDYQLALEKRGMTVGRIGVEPAAQFVRSEEQKWGAVIKAAGLKFE